MQHEYEQTLRAPISLLDRRPSSSRWLWSALFAMVVCLSISVYFFWPGPTLDAEVESALRSLTKSQLKVLQSMKRIHEYRLRYKSFLLPLLGSPSSKSKSMTLRETLLLEPVTLQLRQWNQYEQLLERIPNWLDSSLERVQSAVKGNVNGTVDAAHLQDRYSIVGRGCNLAADELQQHVISLKSISLQASDRLGKNFAIQQGQVTVIDADSDLNGESRQSGNETWISMVKHDIGDLVKNIEKTGQDAFTQLQKMGTAHLETVLLLPDDETAFPASNNHTHQTRSGGLIDPQNNRFVLSRPAKATSATEDGKFYIELVLLFFAALSMGILFELISLPSLFGHLLVGMLMGPSCFDQVQNLVQLQTIGSFCLLIIVYTLGAELSVSKILPVLKSSMLVTIVVTVTGMVAVLIIGTLLLDIGAGQALFCGFIFAFSSTLIAIKCLGRLPNDRKSQRLGEMTMAILVIQDVIFCLALAILPNFQSYSTLLRTLLQICFTMGKITIYGFALWMISNLIQKLGYKPCTLHHVQLALAGMAAIAGHHFGGISIELGIFLAAIMTNNEQPSAKPSLSMELLHDSNDQSPAFTINDLAMVFFFASIGLLLDIRFLYGEFLVLILLTTTVMTLKIGISSILFLLTGLSPYGALFAAINIGQVSEVALMLGMRGRQMNLINAECYYLVAGVTTLSMITSPILLKVVLRFSSNDRKSVPTRLTGQLVKSQFVL